ncbi:hypothetical protein ACLQ8T_05645 [Glutamicibacter sp. FR1]|uniref:hypothetical protein n=1 Tax=Glutamicibacter sp. FR1 TaxID=3393744 RepID=UPI0039B11905
MGTNEKHDATYHGGEYTPTTALVHSIYMTAWNSTVDPVDQQDVQDKARDEFTRWLETVRAEAKREALEDMANVLEGQIPSTSHESGQIIAGRNIIRIIRARANQYKETQ